MAKFKTKTGKLQIILNNGTFSVQDKEYRQYMVKFIDDPKMYRMNKLVGSNFALNPYTHPSPGREITCKCDGTTLKDVRNVNPIIYDL